MAYRKDIFNLLAVTTVAPMLLASTQGAEVFGPVCNNEHAHSGRLYYSYSGFNTPSPGGLIPKVYGSWNGYDWALVTTCNSGTTASAMQIKELSALPRYIRLGWDLNAIGLSKARFILEADSEY